MKRIKLVRGFIQRHNSEWGHKLQGGNFCLNLIENLCETNLFINALPLVKCIKELCVAESPSRWHCICFSQCILVFLIIWCKWECHAGSDCGLENAFSRWKTENGHSVWLLCSPSFLWMDPTPPLSCSGSDLHCRGDGGYRNLFFSPVSPCERKKNDPNVAYHIFWFLFCLNHDPGASQMGILPVSIFR